MNAPIDPTANLLEKREQLSQLLMGVQTQVLKIEREIRDIDAIIMNDTRVRIARVVGESNQPPIHTHEIEESRA